MAYPDVVLATPNVSHYWNLDETSGTNITDSVGSDTLTSAGGVTLGSSPIISGSGTSATFVRSSSGRISRATSYPSVSTSYEFWFRSTDAVTDRQCMLFSGSGANGFGVFVNGGATAGKLHYLRQSLQWHDTFYIPGTTRFHHCVLTFDASQNARIYVDGSLLITVSAAPNTPSGGFTIGAETAAGTFAFNGQIDDVSVYSSTLSLATVRAHYESGYPGVSPIKAKPSPSVWQPGKSPAGCTFYMPFTEGSGAPVNSVNGTPATVIGSPGWQTGPYGNQMGGFTTGNYLSQLSASQALHGGFPHWIATFAVGNGAADFWTATRSNGATNFAGINYNAQSTVGSVNYALSGSGGFMHTIGYGLPTGDGRPHVAMGVSYSATDHRLYWDGVQVATSTTSPGTATFDRYYVGVGYFSSPINPLQGSIIAVEGGAGSVPDPMLFAADLLSGEFSPIRASAFKSWLLGREIMIKG